jgi:uridine kinase
MDSNPQKAGHNLSHVYWIGGSGCSGKTTVADRIADEYGFAVYHCDEHWDGENGHLSRAIPSRHPTTCRLAAMGLKKLFLLPPKEYVDLLFDFHIEDFGMVLEDISSLPKGKLVVEGVSFVPELVCQVAPPEQIISMVAFEEFQRENYLRRDFAQEWFRDYTDPQGVFESFMQANALMARSLYERAKQLGMRVLITDKESTISKSLQVVKEHFGL